MTDGSPAGRGRSHDGDQLAVGRAAERTRGPLRRSPNRVPNRVPDSAEVTRTSQTHPPDLLDSPESDRQCANHDPRPAEAVASVSRDRHADRVRVVRRDRRLRGCSSKPLGALPPANASARSWRVASTASTRASSRSRGAASSASMTAIASYATNAASPPASSTSPAPASSPASSGRPPRSPDRTSHRPPAWLPGPDVTSARPRAPPRRERRGFYGHRRSHTGRRRARS